MTNVKPSTPARSVRVTDEEFRVLKKASEILDQPTSQIVQAGVLESAHRLGFYIGGAPVKTPYEGPWPDLPDRGDESTNRNTTFTFEPQTLILLSRAAAHVGVRESLFMIGAAFRYLRDLRAVDKRLRRLKLPDKFEDRSPST